MLNVNVPVDNAEYIEPGGYIAEFINVINEPRKKRLFVELNIVKGEYAGKCLTSTYLNYTKDSMPFFAKTIKMVQESNKNYHWDGNEMGLIGKRIGIIIHTLGHRIPIGNEESYIVQEIEILRFETIKTIHKGEYTKPLDQVVTPDGSTEDVYD